MDTFVGWFTTPAGTGTMWTFNTSTGSRVLRTMTLYAGFTTNNTNLTVSLTPFALPPDVTLDPSPNSTSIDVKDFENAGANSITFTINNAVAADLSNFIWTYNNVNLTALPGAVTFNAANSVPNSEVEINFGHDEMTDYDLGGGVIGLNRVGTYVMTVQATGPGGAPWSAFITVTITNNP
jgi:hypothetical protein